MENRTIKVLVSFLIISFMVGVLSPTVVYADNYLNNNNSFYVADEYSIDHEVKLSKNEKLNNTRVVVSMGDSYSSGEGITPFYGDNNPGDDLSHLRWNFIECLAHRSEHSWPGVLELPR